MYGRHDSHSSKAPFYEPHVPLGNARSNGLSDEEPAADASTSSTVSVDGERPISCAQIYALASRLSSSASAMAREAESLAETGSTARPGEQTGSAPMQKFTTIPSIPSQSQVNAKEQKPAAGKAPRPKSFNPTAKRPLSDFNFFCRDARKLVVEAHPEYTKEQVNKELGRIWSMLDRNSRQHYRVMYVQDKQRYSNDVAAQSDVSNIGLFRSSSQAAYPNTISAGIARSSNNNSSSSTSARVRNIIWKCATEHNCTTSDSPGEQMDIKSSVALVGSETNGSTRSRLLSASQPGFVLQSCPASQQPYSPIPMYRSNTIKSILNDCCDSNSAKETSESDDVDEPLARALARGSGGRSSSLASIYHPLREHRLRETATAISTTIARNQPGNS
ncbi:hypothetical protein LPJ64_000600 [Coemansia asiatica]|uniref:HMG box domain-containing protein n=1 Tax=Coemansia asiatica TaxID=1052880 RepID=A0A9W7XQL1_9FUNG|nr:hypothetical protein LPJ64_000600 [Coemansia asiatica]